MDKKLRFCLVQELYRFHMFGTFTLQALSPSKYFCSESVLIKWGSFKKPKLQSGLGVGTQILMNNQLPYESWKFQKLFWNHGSHAQTVHKNVGLIKFLSLSGQTKAIIDFWPLHNFCMTTKAATCN